MLIQIINEAQESERNRKVDESIDLLYFFIDDMLLAGKFNEINTILGTLQPNDLGINVILTLLTATLPAKRYLPNREDFYIKSTTVINNKELFFGLH